MCPNMSWNIDIWNISCQISVGPTVALETQFPSSHIIVASRMHSYSTCDEAWQLLFHWDGCIGCPNWTKNDGHCWKHTVLAQHLVWVRISWLALHVTDGGLIVSNSNLSVCMWEAAHLSVRLSSWKISQIWDLGLMPCWEEQRKLAVQPYDP